MYILNLKESLPNKTARAVFLPDNFSDPQDDALIFSCFQRNVHFKTRLFFLSNYLCGLKSPYFTCTQDRLFVSHKFAEIIQTVFKIILDFRC